MIAWAFAALALAFADAERRHAPACETAPQGCLAPGSPCDSSGSCPAGLHCVAGLGISDGVFRCLGPCVGEGEP